MKAYAFVLLVALSACSSSKQETNSSTDSIAVDAQYNNTDNVEREPEIEEEHGGVGGSQLNIISDKAILYSEIGGGEETPLSTKTFAPQILEKGKFSFFNGHPDFWYKIRLEDGKEGWVFGNQTDRQIPTDERWDNLYNEFALEYDIIPVGADDAPVAVVELALTGRTPEDDVTFLLLLIATSGDNTIVNLILTNSKGKKLTSRELKGVFKYKADGKIFEKSDKMICFEYGNFKYENGNQVLDAITECYQVDGEFIRDINGD